MNDVDIVRTGRHSSGVACFAFSTLFLSTLDSATP
jgi:hypothetical protein